MTQSSILSQSRQSQDFEILDGVAIAKDSTSIEYKNIDIE
jgi:hypothetical protein